MTPSLDREGLSFTGGGLWAALTFSLDLCLSYTIIPYSIVTVSVVHCAMIIPWKSLKLNIRTDFPSFCQVSQSNMTNHMLSNPGICLLTPMKSLNLNSAAAVDWPQVAPHLFPLVKHSSKFASFWCMYGLPLEFWCLYSQIHMNKKLQRQTEDWHLTVSH